MTKLKGSHSLSVWHQHSPPMHLLQRSGHSLAMHYPAIRDWHGKARKNRWRTPSRWESWALAQLVGRGILTFSPTRPLNHRRDEAKTHGLEYSFPRESKHREKPPWGISTVGRTRQAYFRPSYTPTSCLAGQKNFGFAHLLSSRFAQPTGI